MTIEHFIIKTPSEGAKATFADITMIKGKQLASSLGYSGVTHQFRAWIASIGIQPLPGRRDCYDPKQVRGCLDVASGIVRPATVMAAPEIVNTDLDPLKARRARLGRG